MNQLSILLDKTEALFHQARVSTIEAAAALYEVYKSDAWKDRYASWNEYIPTLGISQSAASKYVNVIEHYVTQGGVSQRILADVEMEKLYLAKNLEGTPEEQVEKALVLSRSDLRSQKVFEDTGEEHVCFCKVCGRKL